MSDGTAVAGADTDVTVEDLDELRTQVRGLVLERSDAGRHAVREVFNAMHSSNPAVTIRARGPRT